MYWMGRYGVTDDAINVYLDCNVAAGQKQSTYPNMVNAKIIRTIKKDLQNKSVSPCFILVGTV